MIRFAFILTAAIILPVAALSEPASDRDLGACDVGPATWWPLTRKECDQKFHGRFYQTNDVGSCTMGHDMAWPVARANCGGVFDPHIDPQYPAAPGAMPRS